MTEQQLLLFLSVADVATLTYYYVYPLYSSSCLALSSSLPFDSLICYIRTSLSLSVSLKFFILWPQMSRTKEDEKERKGRERQIGPVEKATVAARGRGGETVWE